MHSRYRDRKLTTTAQRHTTCPPDISVRYLQSRSGYHHVKGRKSTSGPKLEPLINVSFEVMFNLRSQLQECTARQVDQLWGVIFVKTRAYITWHFTTIIRIFLFLIYNTSHQNSYLFIVTLYCYALVYNKWIKSRDYFTLYQMVQVFITMP